MSNDPKIVKKLLIKAELKLLTPLRIGSGDNDGLTDILVVKDGNGQPIIPGTSLAGILRQGIEDIYGNKAAELYFGSMDKNQSTIFISDVILKNYKYIYRDCVKLNLFTGSGEDGAKFDYQAVERGAKGDVRMELTLRASLTDEEQQLIIKITQTLADMLTAGIKVGAYTSKGLGKIKSVEPAQVFMFDFTDPKSAVTWLDFITEDKLPAAQYRGSEKNSLVPEGTFSMKILAAMNSSLLVKDYDADIKVTSVDRETGMTTERDVVASQLQSSNDYLIPGTSVKGVLYHEAHDILQKIYKHDDVKVTCFLNRLMGYIAKGTGSCSPSRLMVEEIYIAKDNKGLTEVEHTRNRINRFTRATIASALFTEKPLWQTNPALTPLEINLQVKKCTKAEAGLMLLLMKQIFLGKVSFGSGHGIGRGFIEGRYAAITYKPANAECIAEHFVIDNTQKLILPEHADILNGYVKELVSE